jgi:hypothetical protein
MSLTPDDIRRIASVLTTVADCEERAHKPLLATLHAIVEVPERPEPFGWRDWPGLLLSDVERAGHPHSLRFLRLERGPSGWTVVWRRTLVPYGKVVGLDDLASSPQDTPELVLRAELARLNSIRPGEPA